MHLLSPCCIILFHVVLQHSLLFEKTILKVPGNLIENMFNKLPRAVCEKDSVVQVASHMFKIATDTLKTMCCVMIRVLNHVSKLRDLVSLKSANVF